MFYLQMTTYFFWLWNFPEFVLMWLHLRVCIHTYTELNYLLYIQTDHQYILLKEQNNFMSHRMTEPHTKHFPHSPPPKSDPTEKQNKELEECTVQESMHLSHTIRHPVSAPTLLTPPFPPPPLLLICLHPPSLTDCCLFCCAVSHLRNVSDTCPLFYQVPSHLEHSVHLVVLCLRLNVYKIKPDHVSSSNCISYFAAFVV